MKPHTLVWLFDIDGTLITTRGAARQVFARAISALFGVEDDLSDIAFAGRTDPLILGDIWSKHGRTLEPHDEALFWSRVLPDMKAQLEANHGALLPGVLELLDAIDRTPGWVPALLTGNMTQMAAIKLGHFGVRERFAFGAFGEEGPDRNALARIAVARAAERCGVPAERCIVVGDTIHDVACARAAGAQAVAVATGGHTREILAASAPDLLVDALAPIEVVQDFARGLAARV